MNRISLNLSIIYTCMCISLKNDIKNEILMKNPLLTKTSLLLLKRNGLN